MWSSGGTRRAGGQMPVQAHSGREDQESRTSGELLQSLQFGEGLLLYFFEVPSAQVFL